MDCRPRPARFGRPAARPRDGDRAARADPDRADALQRAGGEADGALLAADGVEQALVGSARGAHRDPVPGAFPGRLGRAADLARPGRAGPDGSARRATDAALPGRRADPRRAVTAGRDADTAVPVHRAAAGEARGP